MTHIHGPEIEMTVELQDGAVKVCLRDARPDVLQHLEQLSPAQREELGRQSWRLGFSATSSAFARAQETKLADVGKRLMEDLETQLAAQAATHERAMQQVLARYFDPTDGQVSERLRSFLDDSGVLASLLDRYVGVENSVLADALARQVGEASPLFRKLSPTEGEGVIQLLREQVEEALRQNRTEVVRALDPLEKDGAVGRFLQKLHEKLNSADEDRNEQLLTALAALDQNDESSLISTLLRETRSAHDSLRRAVNPELPDSPLGVVRRTLQELLESRLETQEEQLTELRTEQRKFQSDLREAVARIETRRQEQAKSAHGGADFEEQVLAFVAAEVQSSAWTVEATGSTTGLRPHCKVGDAVIRFTEETAFEGSSLVIEAKRSKAYGIGKALAELDVAMANRGAETGLFVMASSTAPTGFPSFARYGSRLVVTWNPEDRVSDGMLKGAIAAGLALARRKQSSVDKGDINALADIEQRLMKELERLAKIDKLAGRIRKNALGIGDEVRKACNGLEAVVDRAKATLAALDVELRDESAESERPIEVEALGSDQDTSSVPDAAE